MPWHHRSLSLMGIVALLMVSMFAVAACIDDGGNSAEVVDQLEEAVEGVVDEKGGEVEEAVEGVVDEVVEQVEEAVDGVGDQVQEAVQDVGGGQGGGESQPAESGDDGIETLAWALIAVVAVGVLALVFIAGRGSRRSEPQAAAAAQAAR